MSEKKTSSTEDEKQPDPRVAGVATVGWITIAMLGVCIPLVAFVGSSSRLLAASLPLAIILGAGLMSVRIWSSGEKTVNRKENESLKARISELEERLANLEMIDSLEQHFAQRHNSDTGSPSGSEDEPTMGPVPSETES